MTLDLIMPTYDNPSYLIPAVTSLLETRDVYPFRLLIVNNGHPDSVRAWPQKEVEVIQAGRNRGWEGGLALGLQSSTADVVGFINDDIYVPPASRQWAPMLLDEFKDSLVAAVGPSSNVVMGAQNIFIPGLGADSRESPYLIGFFVLIRRAALWAVGGIDETLPGGDDIDLSIRLRRAGYCLKTRRDVFIYHHGFKTGERVHGAYWNSADMLERTDHALIRKHGFGVYWDTLTA